MLKMVLGYVPRNWCDEKLSILRPRVNFNSQVLTSIWGQWREREDTESAQINTATVETGFLVPCEWIPDVSGADEK